MKHCSECNRDRLPEGGIFLSATRWLCAECWLKFLQGRRSLKETV